MKTKPNTINQIVYDLCGFGNQLWNIPLISVSRTD